MEQQIIPADAPMPSMEEWTQRLKTANNVELQRLRMYAHLRFRQNADQEWVIRQQSAEIEMKERGIKP